MRISLCLPTSFRRTFSETNAVNELLFDISFTVSIASARLTLETYFSSCGSENEATECRYGDRIGTLVTTLTALYAVAHALLVYSNRLQTEELAHNVLLYLLMAGNVLFGANALLCQPTPASIVTDDGSAALDQGGTGSVHNCQALLDPEFESSTFYWGYAAAIAAQCFVISGMFLRVCYLPRARPWALHYIGAYGTAGLLWATMAAVEHRLVRIVTAWAWPVLYVALTVLSTRPDVVVPSPLPRHLAVRSRKFFLVMMTQVLQAMVQPTLRYDGGSYSLAAWVLVLLFAFKLLVFDFDNGHRATGFTEPKWLTEVLWSLCGWLLAIGLTILGATVTASLRDVSPHDEFPPLAEDLRSTLRWTMASAVTLCLLSTCGMQLALKGSGKHVRRLGKTNRLLVRSGIALLCLASPLAVGNVSMVGQAAVLALLVVLQVAVDMWARTRVISLAQRRRQLAARVKKQEELPDLEVCGCCGSGGEGRLWWWGAEEAGWLLSVLCCGTAVGTTRTLSDGSSLLGSKDTAGASGGSKTNGASYGAVDGTNRQDYPLSSREQEELSAGGYQAMGELETRSSHTQAGGSGSRTADPSTRGVLCCGHRMGCLTTVAACWTACDAWYAGTVGPESENVLGDTSGKKDAPTAEQRARAREAMEKYRKFRHAVRRFVVGAVATRLDEVLGRIEARKKDRAAVSGKVAPGPPAHQKDGRRLSWRMQARDSAQKQQRQNLRNGLAASAERTGYSLGSNTSLDSLGSGSRPLPVAGQARPFGSGWETGAASGRRDTDSASDSGAEGKVLVSGGSSIDESIGVPVRRVADVDLSEAQAGSTSHRTRPSLRRSAVEARLRSRLPSHGLSQTSSPRSSRRGQTGRPLEMQLRIPEDGPLDLSEDDRPKAGEPGTMVRHGAVDEETGGVAGGTAVDEGWGSMRSFGSPGQGSPRRSLVGAVGAGPTVVPGPTRERRSASNAVPWSAMRRPGAARRQVASGPQGEGASARTGGGARVARRRSMRIPRTGPTVAARPRGRRNSVSGVGGGMMHGNRPESGRLLRREAAIDMATVADVRLRMAFAAIAAGGGAGGGAEGGGGVEGSSDGSGSRAGGGAGGSVETGSAGAAQTAAVAAWGFPFGLPLASPFGGAAGAAVGGGGSARSGGGGDTMSQSSNTLFFE